jgi:multidrug efflux pump subunit AcrA (membrane-fusion protein)
MLKKRRMIIALCIILILCAAIFAVYYFYFMQAEEPQEKNQPIGQSFETEDNAVTVETIHVERQDFYRTVSSYGTVQARETRQLSAPFTGEIRAVMVRSGEKVHKGQLLFRFDTESIASELIQAERNLLKAQNTFAKILFNFPRLSDRSTEEIDSLKEQISELTRSYSAGDISLVEFSDKQTALRVKILNMGGYARTIKEMEAGIPEAQERVLSLEQKLHAADINAPISGTLVYENVNPGTQLNTGNHLASLYNLDKAQALLTVLERDIMKIRVGQQVFLTMGLENAVETTGTVAIVNPIKNKVAGGYTVKVNFDPVDQAVFSGMNVNARIVIETLHDRLVIPESALLREGERYYVFVIKDGTAWWRWVKILHKDGDQVHILEEPFSSDSNAERIKGVDAGERIAVSGHLLLGHKGKALDLTLREQQE